MSAHRAFPLREKWCNSIRFVRSNRCKMEVNQNSGFSFSQNCTIQCRNIESVRLARALHCFRLERIKNMSNRIYIRFNKIKGFIYYSLFSFHCKPSSSSSSVVYCLSSSIIYLLSFVCATAIAPNEMAIDGGKVNNHVHRWSLTICALYFYYTGRYIDENLYYMYRREKLTGDG